MNWFTVYNPENGKHLSGALFVIELGPEGTTVTPKYADNHGPAAHYTLRETAESMARQFDEYGFNFVVQQCAMCSTLGR